MFVGMGIVKWEGKLERKKGRRWLLMGWDIKCGINFFLFLVRKIGNIINYDKKTKTKNQKISETACFVGSKDNSK